jgi:hypothetical protein
MADRYWVGGTGSWAATTTNWSATSGGSGGASVPTLNDDVFFNTLSNATAYTCTLTTTPICRSVTISGPLTGNVTLAGSAAWSIYGSMTIAATGVTRTFTSSIVFRATTTGFTITTNGVALASAITLNGAGGGWTLGSALTTTGAFTVTQGAFNTSNFNLTTSGQFSAIGAATRSITLGSSSITCLNWSALGATNLTLNAGTSTITLTQAVGSFSGGGLTYYNVFKANNGFNINDANNTFNALTNNSVSSTGTFLCQFAGNQTIGTLTVNGGTTPNGRASIQTQNAQAGTQVVLTVGTFVTTNGNIDFRDINLQGAASPLTVALGGDAGNNTNITLAAPKTVYWSLAGGGQWRDNGWATTSGGSRNAANYPLPQDTAIIDDANLDSGATITVGNNPSIGNFDSSTRTLPVTIAFGTNTLQPIYGDFALSSATTITSTTAVLYFYGYNKTQTITSSGASIDIGIQVNNLSTTVVLADALNIGATKTTTLSLGTLNLNGQSLTTNLFSSTGALLRSIAFNGGTMTVSGATFTASGTNLTTSGLGTIDMTSALSKTFAGGEFSYPTLNQGGAGALTITGANTFADITNSVQPATVTFPANTTTTFFDFNLNGTADNLLTINSSIAGTQSTINYVGSSTVDVNFLSIQDSNATPNIATWYAGDTSVNVSNNNGWFFVVQPTLFDTHDGGDRKRDAKKRKTEAAKAKARRDEVLKLFERIVEGKPEVAEEIAQPFVVTQATIQAPAVIDYDAMLASFDRVEQIYNAYIEMDDEDVLLLL